MGDKVTLYVTSAQKRHIVSIFVRGLRAAVFLTAWFCCVLVGWHAACSIGSVTLTHHTGADMKNGQIGSISSGTLRDEDLIDAFSSELEGLILLNGDWLSKPEHFATRDRLNKLIEESNDWLGQDEDERDLDVGSELTNELSDALNEFAPDYCYFGNTDGDGADFGFWLSGDWQQQAKDDGCLFVKDTSDIPGDYRGLVVHVSDHGNATLYAKDATDRLAEIWSVV